MKIALSESAKIAIGLLEKSGYEGYLVGGCVRDSLLGTPLKDIDITTNATPDEVKAVFKGFHVIETGLKHGTLTVIIKKESIEITTYRTDGDYTNNRHPDSVKFSKSLKEDLKRRDFTINAIAYNDNMGLVDYFGGQNDLEKKLIRAVNDPDDRFKEDALRIMRAIRFASTLGFEIEPKTKKAIFENKQRLKNISAERKRQELILLINGKNAGKVVSEYLEALREVINNLQDTGKIIDKLPCKQALRLSALLYKNSENINEILNALKLDNNTKKRVLVLVENCKEQVSLEKADIKRWLNRLGLEGFLTLIELKMAINCEDKENLKKAYEIATQIEKNGECYTLGTLKIKGRDIIALGISKGDKIGEILDKIFNMVLDGELENTSEALMKKAEELKNE